MVNTVSFDGIKLRREIKINWSARQLTSDRIFIHCSSIAPDLINRSGGISPEFSREWCVTQESYTRFCCFKGTRYVKIGGGRFVFAFPSQSGEVRIPKAAKFFGFSAGGYVYVLNLPAGTEYYCRDGIISHSKETGFPNPITLDQIEDVYQAKSGNRLDRVRYHFS